MTLVPTANGVADLAVAGTVQGTRLISTQATGTAPFAVSSTTVVTNLNADLLDGQQGSFYQDAGNINAGTLPVGRGGTGQTSFTAGRVLYGNGTSGLNSSANLTFSGTVLSINGTLEANEKSFNIPHPTQANKRLIYGVLEGPEHAVYCRGTVKGDEIELPEEWAGLVHADTITVQLTPRSRHQKLFVREIRNGKVFIGNSNFVDKFIHADYLIMGTRKDVAKLKTIRDVV